MAGNENDSQQERAAGLKLVGQVGQDPKKESQACAVEAGVAKAVAAKELHSSLEGAEMQPLGLMEGAELELVAALQALQGSASQLGMHPDLLVKRAMEIGREFRKARAALLNQLIDERTKALLERSRGKVQ